MNKLMSAALMAVALSASTGVAFAEERMSETRSVDARVLKVRLGGAINLVLKQGPTPSLTLSGDRNDLARVVSNVSGDTLKIDSDQRGARMHFGSRNEHTIKAELTLPNLNELISDGMGTTTVSGFSGDKMLLALEGAGAITLNSRYKHIDARLGGVGSMTMNSVDSERIDLRLLGAGQIAVNGQAKQLIAALGGVGSLDAEKLRADSVTLDMTGLGSASVHARGSADLKLTGLGSATVYGKPGKRSATARGLGSVHWE